MFLLVYCSASARDMQERYIVSHPADNSTCTMDLTWSYCQRTGDLKDVDLAKGRMNKHKKCNLILKAQNIIEGLDP